MKTALLPAAACGLLLSACFESDGIGFPDDDRTLRPLGTFVGKAVAAGDTVASRRLADVENPKIAVTWRAIGLRDRLAPSTDGLVQATLPIQFSIRMNQAPPPEVLSYTEIAFGVLSLYADVNRNGVFDRVLDPALVPNYRKLDSLAAREVATREAVLEISEIRAQAPTTERFHVDVPGILTRADVAVPETLHVMPKAPNPNFATSYLDAYESILRNENRWERFFAYRKKDNSFYFRIYPEPGHTLGIELRYDRTVHPKPGRESEFRARLHAAVVAKVEFTSTSTAVLNEAFFTGKMDYPYNGYGKGEDWLAGRTIEDLLLFLPTQATLDTLRRAVMTGSFRFTHPERLRIGYNLFRCDDQYYCEVRSQQDSIQVILASSEGFVNKPATPSRNPFTALPKDPPPAEAFARWQGRYALNGSDTVSLMVRNGGLWVETLGLGLMRMLPVDSLGFRSAALDVQGILTPPLAPGLPVRLVQYAGKGRTVTLGTGFPVAEGLAARIDAAEGFARADLPDSLVLRCVGKYDWNGKDTLRVAHAGGDSLRANIPGFPALIFHAAGEGDFRCPHGEWALRFEGTGAAGYSRVVFTNGARKIVVPQTGASPSNLVRSSSAPKAGFAPDGTQEGTGRDTYLGWNGRTRYACSSDKAFLRPGDGFLSALSRKTEEDAISLHQGGESATFRITGRKGRTVLFELRHCAERAATGKRIRVSLRGGGDSADLAPLYGDHQWMAADTAGTYWSFDSLAIDADPYWLTLRQENTEDPKFPNAFDGYRIGPSP